MASALQSKPVPLPAAEALRLLEERARHAQHELASRADAGEDVLHFLAVNGAAATRRAVAANPAAAPKTNQLLADDRDEEVRVALAQKIGRLLPGLLAVERDHLVTLTLATLERLARDETARVRAVLTEEIKHLDCVPKEIVGLLARDSESIVAAPIIEYSPLLSDRDLLEIIANAQVREVLAAVARRKRVSTQVSDAVVKTLDIPAIGALLANTQAQLRKKTLDQIVVLAGEASELHGALVLRPELSPKLIRRIAQFVSASLVELLGERRGLDTKTRASLRQVAHYKLEKGATAAGPKTSDPANEVEAAIGAGKLDDTYIEEAALAGQRETIVLALAHLAHVRGETVRQVLASGSARAVTALAWRAGLSMRSAFRLQTLVMKLKGGDLLPARGGVGFPMTDEEMRWHLQYFNIAD